MNEKSGYQALKIILTIIVAIGCFTVVVTSAFLAFKSYKDFDYELADKVELHLLEAEAIPVKDYKTTDDYFDPEKHTFYKIKILLSNKSNLGYSESSIYFKYSGSGEDSYYTVMKEYRSNDITEEFKYWDSPYIPANSQVMLEHMIFVENGCSELILTYGKRKTQQQLTIKL